MTLHSASILQTISFVSQTAMDQILKTWQVLYRTEGQWKKTLTVFWYQSFQRPVKKLLAWILLSFLSPSSVLWPALHFVRTFVSSSITTFVVCVHRQRNCKLNSGVFRFHWPCSQNAWCQRASPGFSLGWPQCVFMLKVHDVLCFLPVCVYQTSQKSRFFNLVLLIGFFAPPEDTQWPSLHTLCHVHKTLIPTHTHKQHFLCDA